MRGLSHRWTFKPTQTPSSGLGLDPLVARILAARGIVEAEALDRFGQPKLTHLHDPSLIPDLDLAAQRLLDAIGRGESIAIWGDYDVDGVTASAILHHVVHAIEPKARLRIHIPHRINEGYGLNAGGLRQLAQDGVTLIVSVDCGVTAIEPAATARTLGVDLIITDHHSPPASMDDLPDAYAVVHPARPDSTYPFADLSGAGVAYKLAWRLATLAAGSQRVSEPIRRLLIDLLAYAALGTIADVVPLVDENRVIARYGLARIKATPFVGLQSLIEASGLGGESISAEDVGFRLAPRLNACGRLGHARDAAELLVTSSTTRATQIAQSLTRLNDQRRATERTIAQQAQQLALESGMTSDATRAIVLAHEDWHAGVIGIVCSRLVERFGRPTILLQRQGDLCKGSCRSIEGFDIREALSHCAEHLESFGGHPMAAGLTLQSQRLEPFTRAFTHYANEGISQADLLSRLTIDCETTLTELSTQAVRHLEQLGPFGRGNPTPVVLLRGALVDRPPQAFGAGGRHLALRLRHDEHIVKVIGWSWAERRGEIHAGDHVHAAITPKLNEWKGIVTVEPHLRDVAIIR